uniref:Uncharacterized protein n=1 Tax=Noccaea caerulescens TaxID=107243 RepID=A0A1J3DJ41_NOCCA
MRTFESKTVLLIFGRDTILLLQLGNLFFALLLVELLAHLRVLVIQDDEVAIRDVEAGEMVDGVLRVVDILVNDEGRAFGVLVAADPNLANPAVLAEYIVHLLARYVERKVPNVEHSIDLRWEPGVFVAIIVCYHSHSLSPSPSPSVAVDFLIPSPRKSSLYRKRKF